MVGTALLTAPQMRAAEGEAIASGRVTGLVLMQRAGRAASEAIMSRLGPGPRSTVILAGPGNNGGDGYVIATALRAAGWPVAIHALSPPRTVEAGAAAAVCPVPARPIEALDDDACADAPLVVDALFGTGLTRPLTGPARRAIATVEAAGCPVVAVDILSGLCADSGRALGAALWTRPAALTVTFQQMRVGHALADAAALSGPVAVLPIGLDAEVAALQRRDCHAVSVLVTPPDLAKRGGHKYEHGHALVLAGPRGRGGAARMAARAALRVGAGLVTLAPPEAAMAENAARLDAVMLRPVDDAANLRALLADDRINALLLGPGLGRDRVTALLPVALASGRGLILDADALTSDLPRLPPGSVLTPHDGEFARIVPDIAAQLKAPATTGPAFSRVDAARMAAARLGAVVLLKGASTVIAAPDGRAAINAAIGDAAVPWLATAGAGDVLAGIILGLLARRFDPFRAACAGAWLHTAAARRFGPGLIAEDLPDMLPAILRDLDP